MPTSLLHRPTVPDWSRVRARIAGHAWASDAYATLVAQAAEAREQLVIPGPDEPSAWGHHYFCDDDGSRLAFDPTVGTQHRCPTCDRVYDDELRNGAWRTRHHSNAVGLAGRDAVIMLVEADPARALAARDELTMIVERYGADYATYAEHGKHVGIGKVMPQNLDEAIWAITLLRAVRWAGDRLDAGTIAAAERIARGVADLLRPQVSKIHNIHCWMMAALAECAVRLGDEELLEFSASSEFGAIHQLQQGFRAEGLWFEVNAHYHYYTLDALLSWLEAYGSAGLPDEIAAIYRRAVTAPPQLAYSDHLVPAYADGWPDTPVSNFAPQAERATALLGGDGIDLSVFYADGHPRDSVTALVLGPDEVVAPTDPTPPTSFCWPGSGIALLRSDNARIVLRCGPYGGGHDHDDKLAIDVETAPGWRSLDLGTSGYAAEFTQWMRAPGAHSTVAIGGRRQPVSDGEITAFAADRAVGAVSWDGVRLQREIVLSDDGWRDTFQIDLERADEITWVLHGDGAIFASPNPEPAILPERLAGLGLAWLEQPRELVVDNGRVFVSWQVPGAPDAVITVPRGFRCWAGEGPGNPSGLPLGTVVISGYAPAAAITATVAVR